MTDSDPMLAVQLHQAERAVTENPGRTVHELAEDLCLVRELLAERLVDLARTGKVHTAESVRCRVTGRTGLVWRPGPAPVASIVSFGQPSDQREQVA